MCDCVTDTVVKTQAFQFPWCYWAWTGNFVTVSVWSNSSVSAAVGVGGCQEWGDCSGRWCFVWAWTINLWLCQSGQNSDAESQVTIVFLISVQNAGSVKRCFHHWQRSVFRVSWQFSPGVKSWMASALTNAITTINTPTVAAAARA